MKTTPQILREIAERRKLLAKLLERCQAADVPSDVRQMAGELQQASGLAAENQKSA